jgi:hypothetical protein
MRNVLRVFLVIAGLSASGHAAFVKQPYLLDLTDSSIVVRWEISSSQTGKVQYGLTPAYGLVASDTTSATSHQLVLPGLIEDTVYYYRAISGSDTSAKEQFHTPVTPDKPFCFIAYGDDRSDSADHQSVINQMALVKPTPGFMCDIGDLTYSGADTEFQTFFNIEGGLMNHVTLFPALGNHDIANIPNWLTYLPQANGGRYYSFRYGNSAFIAIDVYSTYTPGSTEYNWLVSELQADSADPSIRHIFPFWHEPPYTTNLGHSSNLSIRQYLCPLFEQYHVPIAFMGHNHCYEHSLVNDVHYIITGGGGAPLYPDWGPESTWTVYRDAILEFTLVSVNGDTIISKGVQTDGTVFDSFAVVTPALGVREGKAVSTQFNLGLTAVPNPLAHKTRISFTLPEPGPITLKLYDAAGRLSESLANGVMPAGEHDIVWDSKTLPDGTYVLVLKTGRMSNRVRLVIQR